MASDLSLTGLFQKLKGTEFYSSFFSKSDLSIIDFGFGLGEDLMCLYHNHLFKTLVGIDLRSEEEIVDAYKNKAEKFAFCNTLFDFYKLLQMDEINHPERKNQLTFSEYKQTFDLRFNLKFDDFFFDKNEMNKKYDAVICSNVLHSMSKTSNLTQWTWACIKQTVKQGGIIYVKLHHPSHAEKQHQEIFSDEEFLGLFDGFNIIYCNQNSKEDVKSEIEYKVCLAQRP